MNNPLVAYYKKRAIKKLLEGNVRMIQRFLDGDMELKTLVDILEKQKGKIVLKTSKEFGKSWQECWGKLEMGVADMSLQLIPREEVDQYVQQVSRDYIELIQGYLENNHTF